MKLMQLNTWQARLAQQVTGLIDAEKPDFITAQEIYRGGDTVLAPENMFTLYEKIAEKYPYHSFSPVNALAIARGKAEMGTAIFSSYPIVAESSFFTHGSYMDGISVDNDIHNSRTLQSATIDLGSKTFELLTHHGHWVPNALGDDKSTEKMQNIANHIKTLGQSPIILAGDLNITPESPAMRPFDGLLSDVIASHAINTTLSSIHPLHSKLDIACDHILTSEAINVQDIYTLDAIVSDHKPVILEFTV